MAIVHRLVDWDRKSAGKWVADMAPANDYPLLVAAIVDADAVCYSCRVYHVPVPATWRAQRAWGSSVPAIAWQDNADPK